MSDILKSQIVLSASTTDVSGQTVQVSGCYALTLTATVVVTAATLSAAIKLTGTNDDATALDPSTVLPTIVGGQLITTAPAEITYTANTGVLAFANPPIGTHEVTLAFPNFPKWIRPVYDYTSGGGTVDVRVIVGAWSV